MIEKEMKDRLVSLSFIALKWWGSDPQHFKALKHLQNFYVEKTSS
ncbi:hypothetical protein QY96_00126 [Bacillus thermotolerans]|nr:hypothetical protein QY96_00126 [Bacillus thermotolerans]